MRFYLAIVLAATYNHLFASPVSWPSASSRIGQDIYKACDSDLYIAEFLHPEHAYNCISTSYWSNCSSYSGCSVGAPSYERVPCYKVFDSFPSGSILKCQLTISKPGGGNWTREWSVPATSSCEASCQQYRDEYSSEFPPSGGDSGPEDPEDYEDCEATDGCNWVGAPMGYGVCHCDDTDSGSGSDDKGTGPTSRDGRSNG